MYAQVHNLSVIIVRIGWFPSKTEEAQRLSQYEHGPRVYFSHDDACRFFECCVESNDPQPGECITVFATSRSPDTVRLDLTPAQRFLAYQPQDMWPQGLSFPNKQSRYSPYGTT